MFQEDVGECIVARFEVIARVFGFNETPAALAWYSGSQAVGKTVITTDP